LIKLLEPFFHNLPELVQPDIDFFHFIDFYFIEDFPAFRLLGKEVAFGQDAQMFDMDWRVVSKCSAMALGVIACTAIRTRIARRVGSAIA
jgi:hypothetical protein